MALTGTVIRNMGSHYVVRPDGAGPDIGARAKGSMRLRGLRTTNPVAVGDRVDYDDLERPDRLRLITRIHPRRNYIIRRASNLSKECSILGANLDQAALVATLRHPETPTAFVDRFLATAEAYAVRPLLVVNKTDLLAPGELEAFEALYAGAGYDVAAVCAKTGEGLDGLRLLLEGKVTLLSGNSGVGKSTLVNALVPGAACVTGAISDAHDQGRHTTTFSEMLMLPRGGAVVDTPGVRGFGTIDMDPREVGHFFPDIFKASAACRFNNCTHTHEPGCAVLDAVAAGRIAPSRYQSYLGILQDADQDKYR